MTYEELYDIYYKRVESWIEKNRMIQEAFRNWEIEKGKTPLKNDYDNVSDHVKEIMTKILLVRAGVWAKENCGHFIRELFNNDLGGTISRADEDCMNNLRIIYSSYMNIEYYDLPVKFELPELEESTQDE